MLPPASSFDFFSTSILAGIIPLRYQLMPNVDDIFELEFALGELNLLSDDELIGRSAFIGRVNGMETNHYRIGMAASLDIYNNKSIRTRSFFSKGRFSTGYALHSLFPYRGKFHPQLVKGIINVIGLKPGDTLLDPMMGSGTACIEAQMMGIDAVGIDISPFCYIMGSAKSVAMMEESNSIDRAIHNFENTCKFIANHKGSNEIFNVFKGERLVVLLAYLDAMGYARRVTDKTVIDKFPEVLHRYEHTIRNYWSLKRQLNLRIGASRYYIGDARKLMLDDNSIDGIVTSPPYSFAIDYIENDLPQLEFLGVTIAELRQGLIGLRGGKKKADRIAAYLTDMRTIFSEMSRVLKIGRYCVVIIGSNEIQTGGILFDKELISFAPEYGFTLKKAMLKPIRGIQNSMTDEYVLFFMKVS
jgi:ubiquinone/menaquinone biosynthesis C-methylase UbiE